MQTSSIGHLTFVFERICERVPPLVPESIVADLLGARDHIRHNTFLPLEEVEATVLVFGKLTWPYRKAFEELVTLTEGEIGERYFLDKISTALKARYTEFLVYGGSFRELCGGHPLLFFSSEERAHMCMVLVDVHNEVRDFVYQKALTSDRVKYEKRVTEFRHILRDIEVRLTTLRHMADEEQEHPELAEEIRAQVKAFEEGLCFLSEETRYDAVCHAEDHFVGRRKEKKARAHAHQKRR